MSNEGRGWKREIAALDLDLYVFKAEDGSQRRMVVRNAGWPIWADENTVYFHRLADDGWWSIFKVNASNPNTDQGGVLIQCFLYRPVVVGNSFVVELGVRLKFRCEF